MRQTRLTRRAVLRGLSGSGVLALVGPLIGGCDRGPDCDDVSDLSERELERRIHLGYVDDSSKADRVCGGCRFFRPADRPDACGRCKFVPGPIDPEGHCEAWAPPKDGTDTA